jgi:long-chain acyl-CoA synthetase
MTQPATTDKNSVITLTEAGTLAGLFRERCARTPAKVAFRQYDRPAGIWRDYTWQQMAAEVEHWRHGLRRQQMEPGDRIALWLANSVAWVSCEQAALAEGLIVVPLYEKDNPENLAYIINDCGCRLLVVDSKEQWRQLETCGGRMPALEQVVCLQDCPAANHHGLLQSLAQWLPAEPVPADDPVLQPDDLATIIYTSGTTGRPKGVMLSHLNILWNCHAVLQIHPARPDDIFLSFLPLSHSFERTVGYYIPMMAGCCIAYCRSIQELAEDMRTLRPTILISVPRIYERISARIQERLSRKGMAARLLFNTAIRVGFRRFEAQRDHRQASLPDRLVWPILKRLVADRITAGFGGRIRLAVAGGAPLQEELSRLFIGLGLPLVQGYGLTEAAPVVSANQMADNRPASVGRPLPGIEVRLAEDGELLVRSPGNMQGYWSDPELSREVLDHRGWLRTGDLAQMIDGFIHIIGRSKEIMVTSTGEKVSPAPLESALEQHPLIDQAMMVGEGKPFIAALLVLNPEAWQHTAARLKLEADNPASLETATARKALLQTITPLLHTFPAPSQVHGVFLTHEQWTIDNGLLTPTMKLVRDRISARYKREIEAIYLQHQSNLSPESRKK